MSTETVGCIAELADVIDAASDDELAAQIVHVRKTIGTNARVIDVSEHYVTKWYEEKDIDDMKSAAALAQELGIRVPSIERVVRREEMLECVQARIQGSNLMSIWTDLGLFSTLRLAFQLRGMVSRMRTVTRPTAGSLGTGLCRSLWIEEDMYGIPKHPSYTTLASIVNFWHNLVSFRQEVVKTVEDHRIACSGPMSLDDEQLFFTHHDMAPRNLVLESATGNLWVVDWDEAGFYPAYFEHAGMRNFIVPESWSWWAVLRWKIFAWISSGMYGRESAMLREVRRKSMRFRVARRFNIRAGVTPSARPVED